MQNINKTKIQNGQWKESCSGSEKFLVSYLTSVVVDRACFRKTSEMVRVRSWIKTFDCQFQISEMEMSAKFCAVFIFIFVYDADYLFVSRPFVILKF